MQDNVIPKNNEQQSYPQPAVPQVEYTGSEGQESYGGEQGQAQTQANPETSGQNYNVPLASHSGEYLPIAPQSQEAPPQISHSTEVRDFVAQSGTPSLQYELQPNQIHPESKDGENVFRNPNLDPGVVPTQQASSVTGTQVAARMSGYPVSSLYSANPQVAMVYQTAIAGDPRSAQTWQAVYVYKIVQVILSALGISR